MKNATDIKEMLKQHVTDRQVKGVTITKESVIVKLDVSVMDIMLNKSFLNVIKGKLEESFPKHKVKLLVPNY
jgi:hypothetical protein